MEPMTLTADPVIGTLARSEPLTWLRTGLPPIAGAFAETGLDPTLITDAAARLRRFAPWFAEAFPETRAAGGIVESGLAEAAGLRALGNARLGAHLRGRLLLKRDDALPVSGSIKARGGFHEVLEFAEAVAREASLDAEDPRTYGSRSFRDAARTYSVVVGSTGNLGMSIGILSAALGFSVTVHMSADAREWKKALLRERGVEVVEHRGPFDEAVAAGRAAAGDDPRVHFVDDESSVSLFAGYATAAARLRAQLEERGVRIDARHPLVVHLPCGVGGGPGGVTYGLKREFGDSVRCVFAEPVRSPAMALGVRSGLHSDICVQDIGLSGLTAADGLAVSRPSRFIGERLAPMIDGFATVGDAVMQAGVAVLEEAEGIRIEPSAAAGLTLPWRMARAAEAGGLPASWNSPETVHLVWLTGGSMVPAEEMEAYLEQGRALAEEFTADAALFAE
ncbi:D-serine ammonia-lyase [Brevibacterium album]|uniref:D-serine ammonia-lyase n=1 Tax=Brevibacterium album TaxID=417948 RepID=UPI00048E3A41|nr:D-serine ammonia-lyase [Brevibacterium album]